MTSNDPKDEQVPASRRIAEALRVKITSGELAEGAQLPSERELASQYGTARNTAREAVRLLSEEGLVTAVHGSGVFVRTTKPVIRLGNDRYSHTYRDSGLSPFLIECQRQGKTGRFEVLNISRAEAPADVAKTLGLTPESRAVLRRENVFYADADPVQYVITYIPWTIADGTGLLEAEVPHHYGIHGVLEDQGYVMARLSDEITARMPRPEEREYLQIPPGVPVIDVLHTSLDGQGRAYEATRFVLRADMNGLSYNTPVE